jgi:uncharacterized lipoprotein YbaY
MLRGQVVFDDSTQSFDGATLYVSLEDTTMADESAVIIARQVTQDVAYDAHARNTLPFAFDGVVPDERAHYTVRVLVDLDGDGKISKGDFINVQSYPVMTRGAPREVAVRVKRVG